MKVLYLENDLMIWGLEGVILGEQFKVRGDWEYVLLEEQFIVRGTGMIFYS